VLPLVSSFHVRRISVRVGDRIIGRHVRITVDDALYPITPSSSVRQRGVNTRRAKLSGNQADRRTHRTRRPVSFIASEKEQLLLQNRTTQNATRPVRLRARGYNVWHPPSGRGIDAASGGILEIGPGVQGRIGRQPVSFAVKFVRAALGLNQDNRSSAPAKLRREMFRQHLKFLNRADVYALAILVLRVVVVGDPIGLKGRSAR